MEKATSDYRLPGEKPMEITCADGTVMRGFGMRIIRDDAVPPGEAFMVPALVRKPHETAAGSVRIINIDKP